MSQVEEHPFKVETEEPGKYTQPENTAEESRGKAASGESGEGVDKVDWEITAMMKHGTWLVIACTKDVIEDVADTGVLLHALHSCVLKKPVQKYYSNAVWNSKARGRERE